MKNGDCKFGSSCRYHHPHWVVSNTNCVLSSVGLPLRPGVQPCTFYLQKGHCKFGRACKFDHPIIGTTVRYSPSASSLTNIPVAPPYALGSSIAPSISFSELCPILISVSKLDPHLSRGVPSTGNTSTSSVGLIYSQMSSLSLSDVHWSTQGSPTSSITSRSTRLRGKVRRSI